MKNKLSIIIPCYNSPEYLDILLTSIFINGSKNRENLEILIGLDGLGHLYENLISKWTDKLENKWDWKIINFQTNKGINKILNYLVNISSYENILILNEDNILGENFYNLINNLPEKTLIIPNQIEMPNYSSIFLDFHKWDIGNGTNEELVLKFNEYSKTINKTFLNENGWTFPILMKRIDYLKVGGFDESFIGSNVSDWDFFIKCELNGYNSVRNFENHVYHFGGKSTKKTKEQEQDTRTKEAKALQQLYNKWKVPPYRNPTTNSNLHPSLK